MKQAVADAPADQGQDFSFFTSLGNFDLDDDADPTLSNSVTFADQLPGQYDVIESLSVPGWSLTGLTCGPGGSADLVNARATITLLAGADVTCTFTNTQSLASLTIVKDAFPTGRKTSSSTRPATASRASRSTTTTTRHGRTR